MGGSIGLVSTEGAGSTFWIEFPAIANPSHTPDPACPAGAGPVHLVGENLGDPPQSTRFCGKQGSTRSLACLQNYRICLPELAATPLVLIMAADQAIAIAEKYLKDRPGCRWILASSTSVRITTSRAYGRRVLLNGFML